MAYKTEELRGGTSSISSLCSQEENLADETLIEF